MDREVRERLLKVNRRFYQSFGEAFAATRARLQPGILRVLERIPDTADVLDLGCGHGLIADFLSAAAHSGRYVGLDSSPELLRMAQAQATDMPTSFVLADMAEPGWERAVDGSFDLICAFAVLHHLPGAELRRRWAIAAASRIAPAGWLAVSIWDFLSAPSLRERILPWDRVGLDEGMVDEGDYLVDWRHQGSGMRYVHHFTLEELEHLAGDAGLTVSETFRSDGRNDRLGLYQIWRRPAPDFK